MGRTTPYQASFNGGELSERMMGRADQSAYAISGEKLENFVPLVQGPLLKRSGTRHVAAAKGPCILIDYEFNTTQAYVIEAGAGYLRFFTNNAQILSTGVPYEVATPYTIDQVRALDHAASGDVLYLVDGAHQQRILSRTGAESFALATFDTSGGPFDDGNSDQSITVSASNSIGSVTLTASASIFLAGHVGGLFLMEARDYAEIPAWEPDASVAADDLRCWEGRVYLMVGGAARTGTVPPIHSEGAEWDGSGTGTDTAGNARGGVQWQYLHDRFGILKITALTSSTVVSATVLRRLPGNSAAANDYTPPIRPAPGDENWAPPPGGTSYAAPYTWRWSFGAFSDARGWPDAVFIWNERLVLAKGNTLYGSVVGAYSDFRERNEAGEISADMAFRFTLNSPNAIRWIGGDEKLLIGTSKKEHVAGPASNAGAAGPLNFKAPAHSSTGSAPVRPVEVSGRHLFVERSSRRLMELDYGIERDRFEPDDLTVMAEHIGRAGFAWLAWQQSPHSLVWGGMADGTLAAMTYLPKQEVRSWCRATLAEGSAARWGCCIPDPGGQRDQLWLAVERAGAWWIERLEAFWETGDARNSAFFVDHGLSYAGAPASVISGLDHLAGEEVAVLADGSPVPALTVSAAGAITLARPASSVHVGKAYRATFKSLRLEAGGDDGSGQGKVKRLHKLVIRVLETLGLRYAVQGEDYTPIEHRLASDNLSEAVPLYTGDVQLDCIGIYERNGQVEIESFQPLPACILALIPTAMVGIQ